MRNLRPFDSYFVNGLEVDENFDGYVYGANGASLRRVKKIPDPTVESDFGEDILNVADVMATDLNDTAITNAVIRSVHLANGKLYISCKPQSTASAEEDKYFLVICDENDPTNTGRLAKKTDGSILRIGYDGSTHTTECYILDRGFCWVKKAKGDLKVNDVLFVEYKSGATGIEQDVWYSTDGENFTEIAVFNADVANIGHIHAIQQDPFTGDIYISTGDTNAESGIIAWTGTISDWPTGSNLNPSTLISLSGFGGWAGSQKVRAVMVAFNRDYVYWGADQRTVADQGIYRATRSFETETRLVDNTGIIAGNNMWGIDILDGTLVAISQKDDADTTNTYIQLIASDNGTDWHDIGRMESENTASAASIAPHLFKVVDNKLYVDYTRPAATTSARCWSFEWDGTVFSGSAKPLAPAVFVSSRTGSDTLGRIGSGEYRGARRALPVQTTAALDSNNAISPGHRVQRIDRDSFVNETVITSTGFSPAIGLWGSNGQEAAAGSPDAEIWGETVSAQLGNRNFSSNRAFI